MPKIAAKLFSAANPDAPLPVKPSILKWEACILIVLTNKLPIGTK